LIRDESYSMREEKYNINVTYKHSEDKCVFLRSLATLTQLSTVTLLANIVSRILIYSDLHWWERETLNQDYISCSSINGINYLLR